MDAGEIDRWLAKYIAFNIQKDVERSCSGKYMHDDLASAQAEVDRMEASYEGHVFNAYKCRHCVGYHVGHAPGSKPKETRNEN